MSSPWKQCAPIENMNFSEIMSEEYARNLQQQENKRYDEQQAAKQEAAAAIHGADIAAATKDKVAVAVAGDGVEVNDCSALPETVDSLPEEFAAACEPDCESDAAIAILLQAQLDREYNDELRRIEKTRNHSSKITVTLDKFRRSGDLNFLLDDVLDEEEDEEARLKRDWDRFETNEKILETIPKCGFMVNEDGEMITKHDAKLCGVRNACRTMSFPPELQTGDAAGFDMELSNKVFNQLKSYSRRGTKKNKHSDRKQNIATAEMGLDTKTTLLLYKLINNQILETINGIISMGKEAVIVYARSYPNYKPSGENEHGRNAVQLTPEEMPKECVVKIFKTTLNEFKQRDRYIKDDFRFRDRFSSQNHKAVINMWAEKEMHNLMRMRKCGINCPLVVLLRKHLLVISFIGDNGNAAKKLKDTYLDDADLAIAYEQVVDMMYKLFNEAKLVHADLSEYNILWYDDKCWFIDVAQAVEPEHPSAIEFLMRDCGNIVNFFTKRGLPNIYNKEQLFEHITSLNAQEHNVAMLERIHTRGANVLQATDPYQENCPDELKPLVFPFDLAWENTQQQAMSAIDQAANAMEVLSVKCSVEAATEKHVQTELPAPLAAVNTANN